MDAKRVCTSTLTFLLFTAYYCWCEDAEPDAGPIFMLEPPSNVLIQSHIGAMISCTAYGKPVPSMYWAKADGSRVNDMPGILKIHANNSLQILPFQGPLLSDVHRASLRCVARNSVGTILSRRVHIKTVKIDDYSSYVVSTQDFWAMLGNTAVFTCDVRPSFVKPYISVVTWYIDGKAVVNDERYYVLETSLHVMGVTEADDGKQVKCVTLNHLLPKMRKESSPVTLHVINPIQTSPTIEYKADSITAASGGDVVLPCVAQGFPLPQSVWFKDGDLVKPSTRVSLTGGDLRLTALSSNDSGLYRCNASNVHGSSVATTNLVVLEPLSVDINPRTQKVDAGLSAWLNCSVAGGPISQVTWYKNGIPLIQTDNVRFEDDHSLHILSVSRRDVGMYQCMVGSVKDNSQASSQLQLGLSKPVFQREFEAEYQHPGSDLSLRCQVYGNPIPTVRWLLADSDVVPSSRVKTGSFITPEGDVVSHVNITDMQVSDGGIYTCVANSSVGSATQELNLNVYGAPIVRSMNNITAVANQTLTVRCHVSGYPISSISWYKDGDMLRRDHRVSLTITGFLTISPVETMDKGLYTCMANNSMGQQSTSSLHINIITQPVLQPITFPALTQGDPYAVICQIKDGDLPIQLSWYRNGQAITATDFPNLKIKANPPYMSTLTFTSVQTTDVGNYTCLAENLAGSVLSTGVLSRVDVEPFWLTKPEDTSVLLGSTAILPCVGEGSPSPLVTWKKAIDYSAGRYRVLSIHESEKYEVTNDGSLKVKAADKTDDEYFLCHVDNGIGPGISQAVLLSVNVPAMFEERLAHQDATVDEKTTLTCDAIGDQPIDVSWSYNTMSTGKWLQIPNNSPRFRSLSVVSEFGLQASLTIGSVQRDDTGEYMCTTKNQYGHAIRLIKLTVKEVPSQLSKLTVTEVSSREVALSWILADDGNSVVKMYYVQYALVSNSWVDISDGLMTKTNTITIRGLLPATSYKFRVAAENSVGKGDWSSELRLTTKEEPPSAAPLEVKVFPVSFSSLNISWKAPPASFWHGPLLGHRIQYRTFTGEEEYKEVTIPNMAKTSFILSNLKANTSYELLISSYNSRGSGPAADPIVAVTFENTPGMPPVNVRASAFDTTIKVMWNKPKLPYMFGEILGYKAICHSANADQDESDQTVLLTEELSVTFTDLKIASAYSVQVLAYSVYGDGVRSYPLIVSTPPQVPGPPTDLRCSSANESSILVSWGEPKPTTGKIQTYQLSVKYGTSIIRDLLITQPNLSTSYLVTELAPNKEYSFIVKARNMQTRYGNSVSVTCEASATSKPSFPVVQTELRVAYHEQMMLDCPAVSSSVDEFLWTRNNGQPLPSHYNVFANGTLYVAHVLADDSGTITCTASNKYGSASLTYTVIILVDDENGEALPEPPVLSYSALTSSAVQLNWISTGNGGHNITGWAVEHGSGDDDRWLTDVLAADKRSFWVDDLTCGTEYSIRMRSQNREGSSAYSRVLTVSTTGSKPSLANDMDMITSYSMTSIELDLSQWRDGGCRVTGYGIAVSEVSGKVIRVVSDIDPAQTSYVIGDLSAATWYVVEVSATNSAGSQSVVVHVSTLTADGYTIAPLKRAAESDADMTSKRSASILVPVCLLVLVALIAVAGFIYYVKRRRQTMQYKSRSKSRQSMFSDISDIDPHHGIRQHFNIPRENISGDSRLWLLHSQSGSHQLSSESNHALKSEGDYEVCTPTLSYVKARIAQSAECPCGHNTMRNNCVYCLEDKTQLLQEPKVNSNRLTKSEHVKPYDVLFVDDEFPPPPPEALACLQLDPPGKRCASHLEFMQRVGAGVDVKSRPNTTGMHRTDTPGAISKQPSCLSSALTMSSNHEELLMAYNNSKLYPLSPIQFETPHKLLSSRSLESSDTTEPGIRLFTQSPPKPEETRQAVCEVPIYHCTLPDPDPKYDTDSTATTTDQELQHQQRKTIYHHRHKSPYRRPHKKKSKRHRAVTATAAGFRDDNNYSDAMSSNSEQTTRTGRSLTSRSDSTSDMGYESRNKNSFPYTDSSHRTASRPRSQEFIDTEEERMSLVHTAAKSGETTPPRAQRHLSASVPSAAMRSAEQLERPDPEILGRCYRTIPNDRQKTSLEDGYTDDYTIV